MVGVKIFECAGCGTEALAVYNEPPEGWRITDAPWCPDCSWLA